MAKYGWQYCTHCFRCYRSYARPFKIEPAMCCSNRWGELLGYRFWAPPELEPILASAKVLGGSDAVQVAVRAWAYGA